MGINKYSFMCSVSDIFDEAKTTKEIDLEYIEMQHTVYELYRQSKELLILDIKKNKGVL
jgi:hypothetical protein